MMNERTIPIDIFNRMDQRKKRLPYKGDPKRPVELLRDVPNPYTIKHKKLSLRSRASTYESPPDLIPVSYTHLTLPTNREV